MLAILSAPGSRGDVNPMVAIGKQLRRRGFDVVISLAQPYAAVAEASDLIAEPVISSSRFDELLGDPVVWKPIRGVRRILKQVAAEFLPLHLDVIRKHHQDRETILVSHPLDLASRVYRETNDTTPLVDVHLAPATLRVPEAPAKLSPWWFEVSRPTWAVKTSYWIADRLVLDPALKPSLGKMRRELGLPRASRYLHQWWLSPDRIIAMFPEWFAPETASVSPFLTHAGFPLDDVANSDGENAERFANDRSEGPVIFTAGTAHRHCRDFFRDAVETCRQLNREGILLSAHRENVPAQLPSNVSHSTYAPLKQVLSGASAIVHHGGIGTTSQALAAGVPQVIRPNAFDQFDNAIRIQRLGVGRWMTKDRQLTNLVDEALNDSNMANCCHEVSRRFSSDPDSSAKAAADQIERMMSRVP